MGSLWQSVRIAWNSALASNRRKAIIDANNIPGLRSHIHTNGLNRCNGCYWVSMGVTPVKYECDSKHLRNMTHWSKNSLFYRKNTEHSKPVCLYSVILYVYIYHKSSWSVYIPCCDMKKYIWNLCGRLAIKIKHMVLVRCPFPKSTQCHSWNGREEHHIPTVNKSIYRTLSW